MLAAGVGLGLLAGATVVGAQGGGTIYACVFDNPTGPNVRIVTEADLPCPVRSEPLSWAVEGPQGPQGVAGNQGLPGPQGVAGAKGSTGAVGPPGAAGAGAVAWGRFKSGFKVLKKGQSTSLDLKLPQAGLYAVIAKAAFQASNYNCTLRRLGKPSSAYHDESFGGGAAGGGTVFLHFLYDFPAGGVARLRCSNYSNQQATVSNRKITAIKLGGFLNVGG